MATRCTGLTKKGERCRRKVASGAWCGRCIGPYIGNTRDASVPTHPQPEPDPFADQGDTAELDGDLETIGRHLSNPRPKVDAPDNWFKSCTKCGGTGNWSPKSDDKQGGTCSACNGSGRNFTTAGKAAYKQAKADAAATARDDTLEAFRDDPEFAGAVANVLRDAEQVSQATEGTPQHFPPRYVHESAYLNDMAHYPQFTHSIAFKAVDGGRWSDKQRDALVRAVGETDNPPDPVEKAPAPSGKTVADVTVVKVEDRQGHYGAQTKMLVEHEDGWRAWMTAPAALERDEPYDRDALRGVRIRVEANLEPSDDDPSFAFGKRPKIVQPDGWEGSPVDSPTIISWATTNGHDRSEVEHAWHTARGVPGSAGDRAAITRGLLTGDEKLLVKYAVRPDGSTMSYKEQKAALAALSQGNEG